MRYLILLNDDEANEPAPDTPQWKEMIAGYTRFEELAVDAIVMGEALHGQAEATTVRPGEGQPLISSGPFTEATEVIGGIFVLDAPDVDAIVEMVRHIPATWTGATEVRPMAEWFDHGDGAAGTDGRLRQAAFIWDTEADQPETPEWEASAAAHARFTETAGPLLRAGGTLQPATTAVTVRVRDDQVSVTPGPFPQSPQVVRGLYLLHASAPAEALAVVAAIPTSPDGGIEVRPIMEMGEYMDG